MITAAGAGLIPGDLVLPLVEPVLGQLAAFDVAPPLLRHDAYRGAAARFRAAGSWPCQRRIFSLSARPAPGRS